MDTNSAPEQTHPWRIALLLVALAVAGAAHVLPIDHHLAEAPYMGLAFIAFSLTCVVAMLLVSAQPSHGVLAGVATMNVAAILMYAATRVVAFPQLAHDVGQWWEPWGVVAVAAELVATIVALSLIRITARRRVFASAAVGLVLVTSACNGGTAAPAGAEVTVRLLAFTPSELNVAVGTTVTWRSAESITHTVTSGAATGIDPTTGLRTGETADGRFDAQLPTTGATHEYRFEQAGTYSYYCAIHKGMNAQIVVR